ncbi:MAG: 2-amino-4-hydroxy-6-hydroxymethyldihydropteridine diphosphokinase [Pirellula sp.]|nr:2-amino-4-hydroxy-6-hydroxymethyldihydropteridine diphosphokinase [Pirellula sp.]
MARLLISLGANLGNTYETMVAASKLLIDAFGKSSTYFSRLYRTPPVGGPTGQSDFLNAVARIETSLNCWEVWDVIKRIERDLGRQRQQRWEARRIDMDILLHGDARIWTPHLKIPHPRMCMRSFVIIPALDVAGEAIDPVTQWTVERLFQNLCDASLRTTLVCSNIAHTLEDLRTGFKGLGEQSKVPTLRFAICDRPENLKSDVRFAQGEIALTIVCVRTPDPESVQWEDYSYPWAQALGFTPSSEGFPLEGPRYLLPANDIPWAVHEIDASRMAMTCDVQPLDDSWS